jgi:hypothetical protein
LLLYIALIEKSMPEGTMPKKKKNASNETARPVKSPIVTLTDIRALIIVWAGPFDLPRLGRVGRFSDMAETMLNFLPLNLRDSFFLPLNLRDSFFASQFDLVDCK